MTIRYTTFKYKFFFLFTIACTNYYYNMQEEIKTLTELCANRKVQYEQLENDLRRERKELVKRCFAAQNRLNSNQNEYKKKLEVMTKTYKTVVDVSIMGHSVK